MLVKQKNKNKTKLNGERVLRLQRVCVLQHVLISFGLRYSMTKRHTFNTTNAHIFNLHINLI